MGNAQLENVLRHLREMVNAEESVDASDGELLQSFSARQEESAFVALLKRHGSMVYRVCRRVGNSEHDAEDAFQATFLLLARKAGSIRKQESVASWLHGVAYRLALEAKVHGSRRRSCEKRAVEMRKTSADSAIAGRELQMELDDALGQVPEKYRAPLLLCYLEGKTHEQAARQLGCPLGTLRSRIARGRSRLRDVLERRGLSFSATALATALLASDASAAVVSNNILHATAQAALIYAGSGIVPTFVSTRTAALLEKGLRAMFLAKLKVATAVLFVLGVFGLGVGAVVPRMLAHPFTPTSESHPQPALDLNSFQGATVPARKAEPSPATLASADEVTQHKAIIHGRVLDNHGKPRADARLLLLGEDNRPVVLGTSAADGQFSVEMSRDRKNHYLVAYYAGLGLDAVECSGSQPPAEVTLRLPEEVPITGRVVNTEGKPIAGVSISAAAIAVPAKDSLDEYLSAWLIELRDTLNKPMKGIEGPLNAITGIVTTDKEGKFVLHGAGAERLVNLILSGGGIARSTPYVVTRPGFDPKPYNAVLLKKENENLRLNRFLGLYPPSFTFVAEPAKTIGGVVKETGSGRPIAGCRLLVGTGYGDAVVAVSDSNGKYRMDGLSKNARGYTISVGPPKDLGYLQRTVSVSDTTGYTPIKTDIQLTKGVVVVGQVVDRQTGKGVVAGIRFSPLPGNPFFGSNVRFDNYRPDGLVQLTGKDGRFRLITIPGKALILVQVPGGEKFDGNNLCPYRRAVPDPDHKELFHYDEDDDSWTISTADGDEELRIENAVKVLDIKEDGETNVDLFVDRGTTGRIQVQDDKGKPLAGAWVAGLTDSWPITYRLPEATATIYALKPEKPRTVAVYHPARNLGCVVTIRGDEKEPVVARLAPAARVTGRLLEADGNPLTRAEVSIDGQREIFNELYRLARPSGSTVVTDEQGRFTMSGVVPGMPIRLQIRKGESNFGGKPKIGQRQLKPGENLTLGDWRMELLP